MWKPGRCSLPLLFMFFLFLFGITILVEPCRTSCTFAHPRAGGGDRTQPDGSRCPFVRGPLSRRFPLGRCPDKSWAKLPLMSGRGLFQRTILWAMPAVRTLLARNLGVRSGAQQDSPTFSFARNVSRVPLVATLAMTRAAWPPLSLEIDSGFLSAERMHALPERKER